MKLPLLLLLAAAPMAFGQYSVLYEGDFSGTERPEGWVLANTNEGTEAQATGNGVSINPGSSTSDAGNFVIVPFPAVTLEKDGDYIAMNFTLTVKNVPAQDNNIRFGLFDSGNEVLSEDSPGRDHTSLRDDAGYVFRVATDPSDNFGKVSRYYVSEGKGQTAALTSNIGFQRQLGDENLTGVFLNNQSKKVEFILTRQGDKLDFKVSFNGNLQTDGRVVDAPPTFRFNQAVFSIMNPNTPITLSDLIIEANGQKEE